MSDLHMQYSEILNLTIPQAAMLLNANENLKTARAQAEEKAYKRALKKGGI